jgi:hypothetical protein
VKPLLSLGQSSAGNWRKPGQGRVYYRHKATPFDQVPTDALVFGLTNSWPDWSATYRADIPEDTGTAADMGGGAIGPRAKPGCAIQLSQLADLQSQMTHFDEEQMQLANKLRLLYVMHDETSVLSYLRTHRRIPELLVEAIAQLRLCFGDPPISLSAKTDENAWEMLYATVQWSGEPKDALAALDRFDDAWWLANSYPAGTALTFTYELV